VRKSALGNGLLTSQDADYVRQRRLVQPLFTQRRIDTYAHTMRQETTAVVDRWVHGDNRTIDVAQESRQLALQVAMRILFGTDVDETTASIRRTFPVLGPYIRRRGVAPIRIPRRWPTPSNRQAAAAQRDLYQVCDRIIAQRQTRRDGDQDPLPGQRRAQQADLLTLLTEAGDSDTDRLTAAEIRDQVLVFLLAGHETTATALAFALHLLACHPDAQARARAEVWQSPETVETPIGVIL
jgi:cytochrome P450